MRQANDHRDEKGQDAERWRVKRHRLQLDFSVDAFERLMRIRRRSEAATNAEVVRNALRLYDWFLEQRHRGASFQVVENGTVKEIESSSDPVPTTGRLPLSLDETLAQAGHLPPPPMWHRG